MPNLKVTQLTADTSPSGDDLVLTVNDPGGTPANRKVTAANLITKAHGLSDGVIKVATGAMTVITAPSGALVGDSDTQTLTSKTINLANNTLVATIAQLNTATSETIVTRTGVLTLTNKTIDGGSNTLQNIPQSAVTSLTSDLSGKQPLDSDLTAIAGLTPTDDDIIQRKAGAWINRTMAQLKTDLSLTKSDVGLSNVTDDAQLKIASNLSDLANAATARTNLGVDAAGTDNSSKASISETNTGTSTTKVVTPDGLAGSYAGAKVVSVYVIDGATALTTGDGKAYIRIPTYLNGMNLISCAIAVIDKSTSGTPTVMLARGRQANATTAHAYVDMLSTALTVDANEYDSKDATAAAVIDTANDDVATGDLIRVDVDVAGTGTKGLIVTLTFQLP